MGLIGALLGSSLLGWLREKIPIARKQVLAFLAVIALQTVFDFMTPVVSMTAHLSGLSLGFLLALLIGRPGMTRNAETLDTEKLRKKHRHNFAVVIAEKEVSTLCNYLY